MSNSLIDDSVYNNGGNLYNSTHSPKNYKFTTVPEPGAFWHEYNLKNKMEYVYQYVNGVWTEAYAENLDTGATESFNASVEIPHNSDTPTNGSDSSAPNNTVKKLYAIDSFNFYSDNARKHFVSVVKAGDVIYYEPTEYADYVNEANYNWYATIFSNNDLKVYVGGQWGYIKPMSNSLIDDSVYNNGGNLYSSTHSPKNYKFTTVPEPGAFWHEYNLKNKMEYVYQYVNGVWTGAYAENLDTGATESFNASVEIPHNSDTPTNGSDSSAPDNTVKKLYAIDSFNFYSDNARKHFVSVVKAGDVIYYEPTEYADYVNEANYNWYATIFSNNDLKVYVGGQWGYIKPMSNSLIDDSVYNNGGNLYSSTHSPKNYKFTTVPEPGAFWHEYNLKNKMEYVYQYVNGVWTGAYAENLDTGATESFR
ncbi:hypothetical protein [Weissella paramesenteroides]|uniref:hypothetical protein n=1 Tax=Weissella paramesenteroides TaxID=1249 RepID=UPI003F7479DA